MARLGYKDSIRWIVENDDTEWLRDFNDPAEFAEDPTPSVTVVFLADIFGVEVDKVVKDIVRQMKKDQCI